MSPLIKGSSILCIPRIQMEANQPPFMDVPGGPVSASMLVTTSADAVVDIQLWKLPVITVLLLIPIGVSYAGRLGLTRPLVIAAGRCLVQLMLLGGVLRVLLNNSTQMHWTVLYITFMMLVASLEAGSRPSMSYVVSFPLAGCWALQQ